MEKKTLTLCGEGLQSFDEIIVDRRHHTKANRERPMGSLRGKVDISDFHGQNSLQFKATAYDQIMAVCGPQLERAIQEIGPALPKTTLRQFQEHLEPISADEIQPGVVFIKRVAKKPKHCSTCHCPIFPGMSYWDRKVIWQRYSQPICKRCKEAQGPTVKVNKPEEVVERLKKTWPLTIEDTELEQLDKDEIVAGLENPSSQPAKSLPSTQEVTDKFIAAKRAAGLQPRSIENYRQVLYSFARQHPALPSRPEEIEAILSSKNSDGTRLGIYKVLCAFYKFANQRFRIPDVMLSVQKPRVKPKEPECLTPKQARMVLSAMETERERGLVYLYLGQGLRLSEALRLDIRDVGEDLLRIKGKERDESAPLLPEVREALLKLAGDRGPSEPLFIGQQGRLGRDMAEENIKRLFIRAGVNGVQQSPKIFRSTFASMALNEGCDFYLVKRLLRHSRGWDVTDRHYIRLNNEELKKTLERYSPLRLLNQHSDKLLVCPNPGLTTDRTETQIPAEADPAGLLPQLLDFAQLTKAEGCCDAAVLVRLLDNMTTLGEAAKEVKRQLGGNGHRPEKEYSKRQASR